MDVRQSLTPPTATRRAPPSYGAEGGTVHKTILLVQKGSTVYWCYIDSLIHVTPGAISDLFYCFDASV